MCSSTGVATRLCRLAPRGRTPALAGSHPEWANEKAPRVGHEGLSLRKKSGDTYFRTFGTIIGSESLTTVFGMGTGVTFQIWSPEEVHGTDRGPIMHLVGRLARVAALGPLGPKRVSRIESVGYMWPSIRPLVPVS